MPSSLHNFLFGINIEKLGRIGALVRLQAEDAVDFDEAQLSSEERLYTRIWGSNLLKTGFFTRGENLMLAGQTITEAHIIIQGQVTAKDEHSEVLMGPGCVIGLAEGLSGRPAQWTIRADSLLNTRVIPMARALEEVRNASPELRSICQMTVMRILDLKKPPKTLEI